MSTVDEDLEVIANLVPRLIGTLLRHFTHDLATYGLTFPQFMTMIALDQTEGESRMGPLAEAAFQSSASMTGIVNRLLERGLVERQRSPDDRRSVVVRLSDDGTTLLTQVQASRHQRWQRLLARLSPEDRTCMCEVLVNLVGAAEEAVAEAAP